MTPLFSPPPKKTDGVVFFQKKRKGTGKKIETKCPVSKKTVEKILLSQVILIVQKSNGHQFEKSLRLSLKNNFSTGKRYRCVFVSSKHQPILQEKKMAEKPIPRELTWKATELGV